MNKKLLIIIILLTIFLPFNVKANSKANISKIKTSCICIHDANGNLDCDNNNCSTKDAKNLLEDKCGEDGTISDITYICEGSTGSSPLEACSCSKSTDDSLKVSISGKCTSSLKPVGNNFCSDISSTARFIGYIWMFLKILVPLMIIFMGSFDYYKAVTSNKDDDLKKQTILFGKRILAGVLFFLLPTILKIVLNTINGWAGVADQYDDCTTCLFSPTECEIKED